MFEVRRSAGPAGCAVARSAGRAGLPILPELTAFSRRSNLMNLLNLLDLAGSADFSRRSNLGVLAALSDFSTLPRCSRRSGLARMRGFPEPPDLTELSTLAGWGNLKDLKGLAVLAGPLSRWLRTRPPSGALESLAGGEPWSRPEPRRAAHLLGASHVLARLGVDRDGLAFLNEVRNLHNHSGIHRGRLKRVGNGCGSHPGVRLDDFEINGFGQ